MLISVLARPINAQCKFTAPLLTTGHCLGDTLTIQTPDSLVQILWYNGSALDSTVRQVDLGVIGVTVAGGDGAGPGAGQFNGPNDIWVDPHGNVYVTDNFNDRVQKWPPGVGAGGTVAGVIGEISGPAGMVGPTGIFMDSNGNLYVADSYNSRVQEFKAGDTLGITVAGGNGQGGAANQLILPSGVFVTPSGYIYVCDVGNNRVQRFPPGSSAATDGVTVAGIGDTQNSSGTRPGQLSGPLGICVDAAGNLYVADKGNHRVQEFLPGSTTGITVAGSPTGSASSQLVCPQDVVVDGHGDIFVSDPCSNRVLEFVPGADSGVTVAGGSVRGSGPGELNFPTGIFDDSAGNLYVADYQNNRVQEYRHHYSIEKSILPTTPGTYTAVVQDGGGCQGTTNPIVINPKTSSAVVISASAADICPGLPVRFTATPSNGGPTPTFQWQLNHRLPDGTGPDSASGPILTDSTLQNGDTIRCTLTSSVLCATPSVSNPIVMAVRPLPTVFAGNDTVILPGSHIQFDPVVSGSVSGYRWEPATGLDNPLISDPIASPAVSTAYELTVTSEDGCIATSGMKVIVYRNLQMPGAFTPNGDGRNDVFRIPSALPQKISRFAIYNRWGDLVFSTSDSGAGWDGSFLGNKQPAGVYVWEVEYLDLLTGKPASAHGTVMLIR